MGITTQGFRMKINTQPIILTQNSVPFERDQDSGFEQVLDSRSEPNSRNGDDYYWQHQSQLQRSALTFNPLLSRAKIPVITPADETMTQPAPPPLATDATQQRPHINIPQERYLPEPTMLSEIDVQQLILTIEKFIENPGNNLEFKMTDQTVSKPSRCQQPINNQASQPNALFKNHQLFLSNNVVELTLNTVPLSKQEAYELQKLIKQWLANKGYSLKQLMINGVQQ